MPFKCRRRRRDLHPYSYNNSSIACYMCNLSPSLIHARRRSGSTWHSSIHYHIPYDDETVEGGREAKLALNIIDNPGTISLTFRGRGERDGAALRLWGAKRIKYRQSSSASTCVVLIKMLPRQQERNRLNKLLSNITFSCVVPGEYLQLYSILFKVVTNDCVQKKKEETTTQLRITLNLIWRFLYRSFLCLFRFLVQKGILSFAKLKCTLLLSILWWCTL